MWEVSSVKSHRVLTIRWISLSILFEIITQPILLSLQNSYSSKKVGASDEAPTFLKNYYSVILQVFP